MEIMEADNRQEEHTVIIYVLWTLRYIPILLHGPPLCLTHAYSEMHKRTYSLLLLRYLTYLFPCPKFCTTMEQNWIVFRLWTQSPSARWEIFMEQELRFGPNGRLSSLYSFKIFWPMKPPYTFNMFLINVANFYVSKTYKFYKNI